MDRCRSENIFISVRLRVHTNLLIIFSQSVNNTRQSKEARNSLNTVEGTQAVNKLVVNLTAGLHKYKDNKNRQ